MPSTTKTNPARIRAGLARLRRSTANWNTTTTSTMGTMSRKVASRVEKAAGIQSIAAQPATMP